VRESERHRVEERVTGFPGPRPGRAYPRMLVWEEGDSQITRIPCSSLILSDDSVGDSTNRASHFYSFLTSYVRTPTRPLPRHVVSWITVVRGTRHCPEAT